MSNYEEITICDRDHRITLEVNWDTWNPSSTSSMDPRVPDGCEAPEFKLLAVHEVKYREADSREVEYHELVPDGQHEYDESTLADMLVEQLRGY